VGEVIADDEAAAIVANDDQVTPGPDEVGIEQKECVRDDDHVVRPGLDIEVCGAPGRQAPG